MHHLDGYFPVQLLIAGAVHVSHAARPNVFHYQIVLAQDFADQAVFFDQDARQASSFRARRIAPAAQTPCRSVWGALLLNILANNADRGASATSSEVARRP